MLLVRDLIRQMLLPIDQRRCWPILKGQSANGKYRNRTADIFSQGNRHHFHWSRAGRSVCGLRSSILKHGAGLGIVWFVVRPSLRLSGGKVLPASKFHPGPFYLVIHRFSYVSHSRAGMVVNGSCHRAFHRGYDGNSHPSSTRRIESSYRLFNAFGLAVPVVSDLARCVCGAGSGDPISQIRWPS